MTGMTIATARLGSALDFAEAHLGLLTTAAMRNAGLDRRQVRALCDDGVLERIVRGLYRLRGTRTPLQDVLAATMRHHDAVASSTSALFVHDLDVEIPERPKLTLPPGSTSRTSLGELHRSPLWPDHVTARHRIPVTTLPRSIVDAAEHLSIDALADVVNQAVSRKLVRIRDVEAAAARLEAAPGRTGSGRLRAVLAAWTDEIRPDSVAEAAAIRQIRSFGLPAPVTQHDVHDDEGEFVARLDMAWPAERVAREYQSDRFHGPERTEADELRAQRLEELGWKIEPLHRRHLRHSDVGWLHQIRRDLAGRRPRTAS
jgi:hypothetical protein